MPRRTPWAVPPSLTHPATQEHAEEQRAKREEIDEEAKELDKKADIVGSTVAGLVDQMDKLRALAEATGTSTAAWDR